VTKEGEDVMAASLSSLNEETISGKGRAGYIPKIREKGNG
jgi:hypothetical protein